MADSTETGKLKAKIEELEQQLAEEREEFEWDLKAAKESSVGTIRKLEGEVTQLKRITVESTRPGTAAKSGEVEMLTKRALMAERRVAELQEELKRAGPLVPPPIPSKEDSVMRQRAETAERERDDLRREKRALERNLKEKTDTLDRTKKELEEAKGLKRALDGLKKESADREREFKQIAQSAEGVSSLREDMARMRESLETAQSEVREKEQKIRELAEELNSLSAAESERDALLKDIEQVRSQLAQTKASLDQARADQSRGADEKEKANQQRIVEMETDISRLNLELAQMNKASGQMVEQRERESARLKSDLEEAQQKDAQAAQQLRETQRELARLRDEVGVVERERDELVLQLRTFREKEQTQVTRQPPSMPGGPIEGSPAKNMFDEMTQRTGTPLGAQAPHPASTADEAVEQVDAGSMPVVTGEMVAPAVTDAEDLFAGEDVSEDVKTDRAIVPPQVQSLHHQEPLPGPPVDQMPITSLAGAEEDPDTKQELEPVPLEEFARSIDVGGGEASFPPVVGGTDGPRVGIVSGQADLETLPDLDEQANGDLLDSAQHATADDSLPISTSASGSVVVSESMQVASASGSSGVPAPPMAEPTRVKKGGGGTPWGLILFILLAIGLIVGAVYFIPVWFGPGGEEGGTDTGGVVAETDAGQAGEATGEDAGTAVATLVDAGTGEGGQPVETTDAGTVATSVSDVDDQEGEGEGEGEAVADPSPELRKAQGLAFKLLKKKKFVQAERLTKKWVAKHPEDPTIHYLYGRALFYQKKVKLAALELEKAIEIDPDMAEAYYELGGIYLIMREKGQACEALGSYLRLAEPDDKRAPGVRKHLKKFKCP